MSARLPRRPMDRRASRVRFRPRLPRALPPGRVFVGALVAVAYIPLLLTHRGMVAADTNADLYLDPARLLGRASSLWDPNDGLGTVTHGTIGYLWPMGPWYRVLAAAGVPAWVAQRLWTGTLLLLAGLGVRWLVRTLGWSGPGLAVATVAYMLSPYVVQYEARSSAILMAFAALPWMLALTIRAARTRSWRYPALFALVAATAGSLNTTGMLFAALGAALWLPFAVWGLGETSARHAVTTFAKMLGLSVLAALWWLAALVVDRGYGLDVLRYSEPVEVAARSGLAIEALRGLATWSFYGRDGVGPWVHAAVDYTQRAWLLVVSFALPVLAFIAAAVIRWRHKLYFAGLILVGVALAVGVHPYGDPSPVGSALKALDGGAAVGSALRAAGQAVPLVALGTAVLLGAGVDALWRRRTVAELEDTGQGRQTMVAVGAAGLVGVLVVLNIAPLWLGQFVDNNYQAPDHVASYWSQAAHYLSSQGRSPAPAGGGPPAPGYATRVLELPGADLSAYRWGTTGDPVTPGLTDRPVVGRALQPSGGAASADLVRALDRRLQEGVLDPAAIAPIARKMGVGDVVLRSDLQYERFQTPRPRSTWEQFDPAPAGLATPVTFGPPVADTPVVPVTDATTLGTPTDASDPPAVAVFGVEQAQSIIRTEPATEPMVVDGDGEGLVDVASAGLLDASQPVFYAADLSRDPAKLSQALDDDADLVVTDTNKLRAQRWNTVRNTYGYTEQPGVEPLEADSADARLPVFPGAGTDSYTVAELGGVVDVRATGYGNSVSYAPAERPDQALDGKVGTAWKVGAFANPVGQRLQIDLDQAVTTGEVTLVQPGNSAIPPPPSAAGGASERPVVAPGTRLITRITLTFDGKDPITRNVDLSSLGSDGERVTFPTRSFKQLAIRIDATNLPQENGQLGNGVGFSEVRIGAGPNTPQADEVLRMPTDLLDRAGASTLQHRLSLIMTRDRANPAETFTADTEEAMARSFDLPTGRSFAIGGSAMVSARAPDQQVDRWLGRPDPAITNSSSRLPGDLAARSSSALDGDPTTAWSPALGPQVGNWISVTLPHPITLDHWTMQVVADGRHSVPTRLRIQVDGRPDVIVDVPPVADQSQPNATVSVPVSIPASVGPLTATSSIVVTIDAVRVEQSVDELTRQPTTLPVGIAELGLPGITVPTAGSSVPAGCRTDLLTVDGQPVGIRVLGTAAAAATGHGLALQACGPGVDPTGALHLGPGRHVVRTAPGLTTGIDINRLVLASDKGGAARSATTPPFRAGGAAGAAGPAAAPAVTVVSQSATSAHLQIAPSASPTPFWLVLGESNNRGWSAQLTGRGGQSLGAPQLIDGYANGWLVTPSAGRALNVSLSWKPQRTINLALWASAIGVLVCVGLVIVSPGLAGVRAPPAPKAGRLPEHPTVYRPWRSFDPDIGRTWSIGAVVGSALITALLIGWPAAAVVAVVVAIGFRRGPWEALPAAAAVAAVGLSALFVIRQQTTHHYALVLGWPARFEAVAGLAWVGVALLAVEALLRHIQARRPRRQ